jgi:nucleotide-binding universal stress UspA family protein
MRPTRGAGQGATVDDEVIVHPGRSKVPMNVPIRRLLAGIATLHADDPALAPALALSTRTGAELQLVHVDPADVTQGRPGILSRTRALTGLVDSAAPGATMTGRVTCRVLTGEPEQVLRATAIASGADLVVLGPTRRGRLAGAVLGTTAGQLLRSTRIPMLVVHEALPDRPLRVLLTTDLSHHAAHAHRRGLELARALGGADEPELRSLFVHPPELGEIPLPAAWPPSAAEHELAEFLRAEVPPVPTTACVRTGDPAHEIVAAAREWGADLVVMGTHGRRGLGRMFLGSVAETVIRTAPCAVLVIPPLRLYSLELDASRATTPGSEVAAIR